MNKTLKTIVYIVAIGLLIYLVSMLFMKIKENLLAYDPKVDDLKRRLALVHPKARGLKFFTDKKSYTINLLNLYFLAFFKKIAIIIAYADNKFRR